MQRTMTTMFDQVAIGEPVTVKKLTVFPLTGIPETRLDYLLIEDALKAQSAIVEEVSEGGSVPELRLTNFAESCILIIDGAELVGAKQNRVVNATLLIPPKTVVTIPVSCVEQGRWRYKGKRFESSDYMAPSEIRKTAIHHQKVSLKEGMGYRSDQGAVWSHVSKAGLHTGVNSATDAMNDVYQRRKDTLEDYQKGIVLRGGESGVAFFVGGAFAGLELFGKQKTFAAMFPKLLSAYGLEAMMVGNRGRTRGQTKMQEDLRAVLIESRVGPLEWYKAPVGIGEDARYEGKRSIGKFLCKQGELIHFSAFAKEALY